MNYRVSLAALGLTIVVASGLIGQEKPQAQQAGDKIDKKVVEIVKQTGDLYKNAKTLYTEGTFISKGGEQGENKETRITATYVVEKPNRLSLRTRVNGDNKDGADVIADGKKLIIFRKGLKQYSEDESPGKLGDVGLGLLRIGVGATGMLFANIVADDPADLLMDGVNSCSYVGKDKVDGTPVHRMKFSQDQFDWELWVASEGKPYILRMISMRETPNGKVTTTETYKNWKVDEAPAKDAFKFVPPKDATKVDSFP